MKPTLFVEKDLFWEEIYQPDYTSIISKYFEVKDVPQSLFSKPQRIRCSLNKAVSLGLRNLLDFTDYSSWLPFLRNYSLNKNIEYRDLNWLGNYAPSDYFPKFIRPNNGRKTFAGQVFNHDKFLEEYNYLTKNLNIEENLLCVVNEPINRISREYRTIFIDNQFVSGCQYMTDETLDVSPFLPDHVRDFSIEISKHPFFINKFDFVIDICEVGANLFLLELNSFICSSFYACDLDRIFSKMSNTSNE